ncbi:MAG: alpha/beta hydrolase [Propionibacteriaceae bacterium]
MSASQVVSVRPDAQPFNAGDGEVAVLLCHGFTGTPRSLRPWAEALHGAGFRVALPRLPGHGTSWHEMNLTGWPDWYGCVERELRVLLRECRVVFVAGLSMGGGLALALAEDYGNAISGIAVVNPSVGSADPTMRAVPVLRRFRASVASIASDIAKPQVSEGGYERTPLHAVASLQRFWRHVGPRLRLVTQPLLVFRSVTDHVVDPSSAKTIFATVSSTDVTERLLHRSYHVATLDYDAEVIFAESIAFFRRLAAERLAQLEEVQR